uniref:PGR5-like protein 1A, chloroplastic n=1 Tax=Oryza rufipogon TaxID=4529 RepID=A0A0E0QLG5_ORYRU
MVAAGGSAAASSTPVCLPPAAKAAAAAVGSGNGGSLRRLWWRRRRLRRPRTAVATAEGGCGDGWWRIRRLLLFYAFYYDKKAVMSNEEFDNLKEELMWEGSSVVMLSPDEQRLLEASMAYVAGNPIMTDAEFDELKLRLRKEGSEIVQEGPRCSLRSRKVYSDLTVDYFKMFLLNVPAAVVALTLFFFLDDLTGFEITYLLELPEPFSFIFTWFAALPLIFWVAQAITSAIVKDFLILKGPCPNCGNENLSFFGTILSVPSGGARNSVKCAKQDRSCTKAIPCIYHGEQDELFIL